MSTRTVESFRSAQDIGTNAAGRIMVRCSTEIGNAAGTVPEWAQVTPWGPQVHAKDGRSFQISDPRRLARASTTPLLLDWDHVSERDNGSTRAAGWCEELVADDGTSGRFPRPGLWARLEFTEEGGKDVAAKAYRFLSPVLILDGETRDALELVSVALTNRPALGMHELSAFRAQFSRLTTGARGSALSAVDARVRAELGERFSAAELDAVAAMDAEHRAATGAGKRAVDAEVDAELLERGFSREQLAEVRRIDAKKRERFFR